METERGIGRLARRGGHVLAARDRSRMLGPFALAGVIAVCGMLSDAHYRALPRLTADDARPAPWELPSVSIIVPARDEERNLPTLLRSLLALDYPDYEIVIVDDASTDATAALAAACAAGDVPGRVRVITGTGPAPGWTGKNYACHLGATAARGEWLLFTDADTEHAPLTLRAAVSAALRRRAGALSLFAGQRCFGFWERLLLPFAYQQYFAGVNPRALDTPDSPALANGQYILVARAAYAAAGGHAAVAASIIDDVALAAALKRAGHPPLLLRGEALVSVRMYAGLPALAAGFGKNATQFVRAQRLAGAVVVAGTAAAAAVPGAFAGAMRARSKAGLAGALLACAAQALALAPWMRRFGVPGRYTLLGPLAGLGFSAIALTSAWASLTGRRVRWKGRAYRPLGVTTGASAATSTSEEARHAAG